MNKKKKTHITGRQTPTTNKHKRLRVAVIGAGNMGRHHIRHYASRPDTELVAVVDADIARANEYAKKYKTKAFSNYKDVIKDGVDAVSVAVPTKLHKSVASDFLNAGTHVLCEKPIAPNIIDAQAMIDLARKKKRVLTVGHIERFNPSVIRLKEMIRGGELGEVKTMIFQRMGTLPPQIKEDNVLVDIGVHDIDIANFLLSSRPLKMYARGQKIFNAKREDVVDSMLIYPGATVHLQTNWITPHKVRRLTLAATKGYVELDFMSQDLRLWRHNYSHEYNDYGEFVMRFGQVNDAEIIEVSKEEPLKYELDAFMAAIQGKKSNYVLPEDARDALMIALALNKAM